MNFFGAPIEKYAFTSKGAQLDLPDIGLSISIPEQTQEGDVDRLSDFLIRPCLSGPFILPDGYVLASPVYVIEASEQGVLQKPCTVQIQHFVRVSNEEDCKNMVFVSSDAKLLSSGEYRFKMIDEPKMKFSPGSHCGEIELKHFCLLAAAKRILAAAKSFIAGKMELKKMGQ